MERKKERRKEGKKERKKERRKEGKKERKKERKKEGKKERKVVIKTSASQKIFFSLSHRNVVSSAHQNVQNVRNELNENHSKTCRLLSIFERLYQ